MTQETDGIETPAPGIGHNLPSTDDPLIGRLGEITVALLEKHQVARICDAGITWPAAGVDNDDKAAKVGDVIKSARAAFKMFDAERVLQKDPFLTSTRKVDTHFAPFLKALKGAQEALQRCLDGYMTRKADAAAKERRRLEEEARQKQAEADAREADASTVQEHEDAAEAKRKAAALDAEARATTGRVHTDGGATVHVKKTWAFTVEDFAEVPDEYKVIAPVAVNDAIRAGERTIPGLRIFQKTKSGVR
jgi:hypothetical protein